MATSPSMSVPCNAGSVFGAVLPTGYAPLAAYEAAGIFPPLPNATYPFMQVTVTQFICAGTVLVFRFYPHGDGFQSEGASTLFFPLLADTPVQTALQLQYAVDSGGNPTIVLATLGDAGTWVNAALPTYVQPITADASCVVFFGNSCGLAATGGGPLRPVCAIGFITTDALPYPILPPCLPCQYALELALPFGGQGVFINTTLLPQKLFVHGEWHRLWQRLVWSDLWSNTAAPDFSDVVTAFEMALVPGQLTPILFAPYDASAPVPVPATWSFVVTATVPANTAVFLDVHGGFDYDFNTPPSSLTVDYAWTSPPYDLPAGTVVTFRGLIGSIEPTANQGIIVRTQPLSPYIGSIQAITALCGVLSDDGSTLAWPAFPVTGSYTCAYTGPVPSQLVPGRDMRATPWPTTPSIALIDSCRLVCDWECQRVLLNRAPLTRWICQPISSSIMSCKPGCKAVGCCGPQPPFIRR